MLLCVYCALKKKRLKRHKVVQSIMQVTYWYADQMWQRQSTTLSSSSSRQTLLILCFLRQVTSRSPFISNQLNAANKKWTVTLYGVLQSHSCPFVFLYSFGCPPHPSLECKTYFTTKWLSIWNSHMPTQVGLQKHTLVNAYSYKKKKHLKTTDYSGYPSPIPPVPLEWPNKEDWKA